MIEQWKELKETIIDLRDNDGTATQQEVCKFLANLMDVLEKQMQEPCEDAISRDAVWDVMQELWGTSGELLDRLMALPPVNPQQKTGHWIKYSISRCGEQHYKCTSCGYYINFGKWGEIYTKKYKYCPNCGAKMVKQQKSEVSDADSN